MSRLYEGLWSVLVVWDEGDREVFGHRGPDTYEEAEKFLYLVGAHAAPYEGHRVKRARIVGPVAGSLARRRVAPD